MCPVRTAGPSQEQAALPSWPRLLRRKNASPSWEQNPHSAAAERCHAHQDATEDCGLHYHLETQQKSLCCLGRSCLVPLGPCWPPHGSGIWRVQCHGSGTSESSEEAHAEGRASSEWTRQSVV